jgi:hypothetical protein
MPATQPADAAGLGEVPPFVLSTSTGPVVLVEGGTAVPIIEEDPEAGMLGMRALVSPDGRHVAVARRATTLDAATLEILSTADGSVVNSAEFGLEVDEAALVSWSPDSTALLVQAGYMGPARVYRIDGTADDVAGGAPGVPIADDPQWYTSPAGRVEWAVCPPEGTSTLLRACSANYPSLITPSRDAVLLVSGQALNIESDTFFRYLGPDVPPEPLPVPVTGMSYRCRDRYALLYNGQEIVGIYDAADSSVTPVPADVDGCPVVGTSGKVFAFKTALGGPPIVVGADGSVTSVARQGTPAGFSQDEQWLLLVDGSSAFRVAADGSGGAEASAAVYQGCSIPPLGLVVAGGVIYDVGADQAVEISGVSGSFEIFADQGLLCTVDANLRWLHYGDVLIDLESAVAIDPELNLGRRDFAWLGDSYTFQPEYWAV